MHDVEATPPSAAVLVGGSGFVGSATAAALRVAGCAVTVVDVVPPPDRALDAGVEWRRCDLLVDDIELPDGDVVLFVGNGDPRTRWRWHQPLQTVVTTGRLAPSLAGRDVTLCSTLEVYGSAPAPLTEHSPNVLPWDDDQLWKWLDRGRPLFDRPCPPWTAAEWCRELLAADPTGRWMYGMAKRAQELLVAEAVGENRLTVLRLANTVGAGQERVVSRLARRADDGRTLEVSHPVLRSFLPADHVARVFLGAPGPGTYIVGSESVELMSIAEHLVGSVGHARSAPPEDEADTAVGDPAVADTAVADPAVADTAAADRRPKVIGVPPGPQDSCGDVRATALDALGLGVGHWSTWIDDAVRSILDPAAAEIHPPVGVVVPPRCVSPDVVTHRQQSALWSGAVKHGNQWSTELEEQLTKELAIGADRQLLATTSGTDALRIMCGAICGPASPGQVVALPSYTFPATAEVVAQLGYLIRFVDVDPVHWTMDAASLAAALEPGDVAAVVAVDTFGNPVDYPALQQVCDRAGVPLLADSAAALGSRVGEDPVGTQAVAHSFSMSFAKVLSAGGAGGAVVLPTDVDPNGPFGWTRSALMNELHAIVALDQLEVLGELVDRRNRNADLYSAAAAHLGLDHQRARPGTRHSWVHFVLRIPGGTARRDQVSSELAALGVGTKAYFDPLHRDTAYDCLRVDGPELSVTDELGDQSLAVPMSSELNDEAIDRICIVLDRVLG